MNLEQLRKQAKELVRAAREGDAAALERLGGEPILARAQLALAREHGFPSWPALVAAAEAERHRRSCAPPRPAGAPAPRRCSRRARRSARDPWARLVLGDGWDGDASTSRAARAAGRRCSTSAHSVLRLASTLARELLAGGADPNVTFTQRVRRHAGALRRGRRRPRPRAHARAARGGRERRTTASRSTTRPRRASPECLRALLEYGGNAGADRPRARARRRAHRSTFELLLDAGADATRAAAVRRAARPRAGDTCGCSSSTARDSSIASGEGWRNPERRAHGVPARRAARPRRLGAGRSPSSAPTRHVDADDLAVAAIARGERPDDGARPTLDYDQQEVLILYALRDGDGARRRPATGPNFRGVVGGSPEGSLLAARRRGSATPSTRGSWSAPAPRSAIALDWCVHGSQYHAIAGRDYVGVAEQLVAAGAVIEPRHLETGRRSARRVARSTAPTVSPNADVIGPLAALRQRPGSAGTGGRATARSSAAIASAAGGAVERLGARRQHRGEHARPADREREVHRRAARPAARRCAARSAAAPSPSARPPSSTSPRSDQRPRRRRERRHDGRGQPCRQRPSPHHRSFRHALRPPPAGRRPPPRRSRSRPRRRSVRSSHGAAPGIRSRR